MSDQSHRIQRGTEVEWTSQSGGHTKTKRGTVLRFVPSGEQLPWKGARRRVMHLEGDRDIPNDTAWSRIMIGSCQSVHNRYLVRVEDDGRLPRFYAPIASDLEWQQRRQEAG